MACSSFDDLPFNKRPDLSPYLIHLTKNTKRNDEYTSYDNLIHILKTGVIWGSGKGGYIRGGKTAACFMYVPFASLKYVLTPENMKPHDPRYEPYGIVVGRKLYANRSLTASGFARRSGVR